MKKPSKNTKKQLAAIERYLEHLKRMWFIREENKSEIKELYENIFEKIK